MMTTMSVDVSGRLWWSPATNTMIQQRVIVAGDVNMVGNHKGCPYTLGCIVGNVIDASNLSTTSLYNADIEFTKAIVEKLPEFKVDRSSELAGRTGERDDAERVQGAALRALRQLLDAKDPQQRWGGLRKVLTPEGHYLWLCEHHAAEYAR